MGRRFAPLRSSPRLIRSGVGDVQAVRNAGFLFEGLFSQGWPGRHGRLDVPEHYELSFVRQFGVGEYGDMMGLFLSISFAAADELRARCAPRVRAKTKVTWSCSSPWQTIGSRRSRPARRSRSR